MKHKPGYFKNLLKKALTEQKSKEKKDIKKAKLGDKPKPNDSVSPVGGNPNDPSNMTPWNEMDPCNKPPFANQCYCTFGFNPSTPGPPYYMEDMWITTWDSVEGFMTSDAVPNQEYVCNIICSYGQNTPGIDSGELMAYLNLYGEPFIEDDGMTINNPDACCQCSEMVPEGCPQNWWTYPPSSQEAMCENCLTTGATASEYCACCDTPSCDDLGSYSQSTYGIDEEGFCYKCNADTYSDLECNCCEDYTPEPGEPGGPDIVEGCTDINADNYLYQANVDDGSCIYLEPPPEIDYTTYCGEDWPLPLEDFVTSIVNDFLEYGSSNDESWGVEEYCSWCEEQGDELPAGADLEMICPCCP